MTKIKETNKENDENYYPGFLVDIVNKRLRTYLEKYDTSPKILRDSIEYSIKNSGKRFRPVLCMITAKSLGKDYELVLPTACAIEFIHTYSLIHDDLPAIDNDDFRRGNPTCHKVFGEDIAILTGDALFAEAFNIILDHQVCSPLIKIKVLKEIGEASGALGMVAGQTVDVFYTGKKITKPVLEYMHTNKTAKLIASSIRCGAILSNADQTLLEGLTSYAYNIGLAFQITDDLLDIEATAEETGKTSGKDYAQNKNTFPSLYGIRKSKIIAHDKIEEAIEALDKMEIDKEWLIKIARFLLKRKK